MRKVVYILLTSLLLVMLSVVEASAQTKKIDSLKAILINTKQDTGKINVLNLLSDELSNIGLHDSAILCTKEAIRISNAVNGKVSCKGTANGYGKMALIYFHQGNYPEAIKNQFIALKMRQEIGDKRGIASSYGNIGNVYYKQGNYPEALKNYFSCLKIFEQINFTEGAASSYNNIGLIYQKQADYVQAIKNYTDALELYKKANDKWGIASCLSNIGIIYFCQKNYVVAIKTHLEALKLDEEVMDNPQGVANDYNNLGNVYARLGNYKEALQNHISSLKIREEIDEKAGVVSSYNNIGIVYINQYKTAEANKWLQKGLQLAKELGIKEEIKNGYQNLIKVDSLLNDYKAAFEHHKLYIVYRDSIDNEETKKKSLQASMQYEFDKKEIAAKAEQDRMDVINAEEKKKQQLFLVLVSCILILVAVFAVFMYNRFRITQKQKAVIEQQKILVDKAYEELHEKNKEVMDSIHYAKRIQTALITSEKYISNSLKRLMRN